ncbi:hypothetical protein TrCOL_g903 [Triparma columacea]|uniref:Uncharacterized protein n=1 Tax=Triparma columacea TaxID=722753 RepID=A0A9W7GMN1_9STRA|nr:hypothetical protein TrCOL_g903 [Triparma columacea]
MLEASSAQLNVSVAATNDSTGNVDSNVSISDDDEGSYSILVALREGEFPNFQNSMRGQLHIMKLKASSHSPVKNAKPHGHAQLSTRSIHEKYASNASGIASPPSLGISAGSDVDNHEPSHTPCVTPFHLKKGKKKRKNKHSDGTSSITNSDTPRSLHLAASSDILKQKVDTVGGTTASLASTVLAGHYSSKKRVLPAFCFESSGAKFPSKPLKGLNKRRRSALASSSLSHPNNEKKSIMAPRRSSDDRTQGNKVYVGGIEGDSERSSEYLDDECEKEESEILIPSETANAPPPEQAQQIARPPPTSPSKLLEASKDSLPLPFPPLPPHHPPSSPTSIQSSTLQREKHSASKPTHPLSNPPLPPPSPSASLSLQSLLAYRVAFSSSSFTRVIDSSDNVAADASELLLRCKSAEDTLNAAILALHDASTSFATLRQCAEELGAKAEGKIRLSTILLKTDSDVEQLSSKLNEASASYNEHRLKMEGNIVRSSLLNNNNQSQSQASFEP